jgi:pilus assembly protein CpaB
MKITRVAVLGVAVGAGVIAAVLAVQLTNRPAQVAPEVVVQTTTDLTQVLVASKDIPTGSTLSEASFKWQDWPKSGVAEQFITKTPGGDPTVKVNGAIARATFYAGEPIVQGKLITSDRGFLAAILPAGQRAVATRIAADTSAGGFILPNDRVDVVMSRQVSSDNGNGGQQNQFVTETILHNVRVLAIDQTIEEKTNGDKVVVGQTATLELSPQQVEILSAAQQMTDRLTLSLRSIVDSQPSTADAAGDAVHLLGGTKQSGSVTVVKNGVAHQETGLH